MVGPSQEEIAAILLEIGQSKKQPRLTTEGRLLDHVGCAGRPGGDRAGDETDRSLRHDDQY